MLHLLSWLIGIAVEMHSPQLLIPTFLPNLEQKPAEQVSQPAEPLASALFSGAATEPVVKRNCSINVVNYDLAKVLQELSGQAKTNLVLIGQADKKLTLRLSNVSLQEMLRHISAVSGLATLKVGDTYALGLESDLARAYPQEWAASKPVIAAQDETVIETYMTRNVDGGQIGDALRKLFEAEKLIVISGPAPSSPTILAQDTNGTLGAGSSSVLQKDASQTATAGRMVVLKGPRSLVQKALEMARSMDYPRSIWSVQVTVHDISNDALKEAGLSWSYSNAAFTENNPSALGLGSFTRAPLSFVARLAALETQSKAKLLSSPSLSAADGERASILIGDRIAYPNLVSFTPTNTPIYEKEEIKVGIYLQVAAIVNDDSSLTLSVFPQVSAIKKFDTINGASYPTIATREAQSTLRIKSGETIVFAGMMRDEEISRMERIPLLSDIPFLGELFKNRRRTKVSSQVIITITPTIIPPK